LLKTILLVAACSIAAFSAGTARTVYSPRQLAVPIGSSIKMTPDVANIWSWHETIAPSPGFGVVTQVLIDLDGDGMMDSQNPHVRVVVTDIQVEGDRTQVFELVDDQGWRWGLNPSSASTGSGTATHHLTTPLVVPVGSGLGVKAGSGTSQFGNPVRVSLIGRVVNL
jgi:hypothetical protein